MKKFISLLCMASILAMIGWKATENKRLELAKREQLLATSDATVFERTVRVQGDDWLGYLIFKSKVMQDELASGGIGLKYEIEPDFEKRVNNLADGSIDLAAMTIDTWLTNGHKKDYPGVIAFIIDESHGGDCVVGGPNVKNLDDLKKPGIKGAFVGNSPSEFLLKSQISHFRLEGAKKNLDKFRVEKIEDAYSKLERGEVDFAVLWEPQTSQALKNIKGTARLMDTAQAQGIVIDVAVMGRKFVKDDPKVGALVTKAYFKALHHYLNRPDELAALGGAFSKTNPESVGKMLAGLTFVSFPANQTVWFGTTSTTSGKLYDGIQDIMNILVSVGDLDKDTLDGNPHTITNSRMLGSIVNSPDIEKLNREIVAPEKVFAPLPKEQWEKLAGNPVGTLVEEPIIFQRGTTEIVDESEEPLTDAVNKIIHYPRYRVVVQASVSQSDDPQADLQLSQERANAVRAWVLKSGKLDENRVFAMGLGSTHLPEKLPRENDKSWERRCRYAKLFLVTD
jgi:ABC-type taurine transport system substrate-binding protein/outer membrane protein OmpA-like peptidoglycan-associated protein